jgi:lipoyl(octanoyl) transferase
MITQLLGRVSFDEAYQLQRELWQRRVKGEIPDQLILLEHDPVITLGRESHPANILVDIKLLEISGIQIVETDRGGDVTYHGPGQLIGYPILNLSPYRMDVLRYLRDLEEVLIQTLAHFQILAHRVEGKTGVWFENQKIASIGVKISRWVTYHGFALNVNTDLSAFDHITPCGLIGVKMTSMEKVLGHKVSLDDVAQVVVRGMTRVFNVDETRKQKIAPMKTIETPSVQIVPTS